MNLGTLCNPNGYTSSTRRAFALFASGLLCLTLTACVGTDTGGNGAASILHAFGAVGSGDGISPQGSLIKASDGNFYGMTGGGGANKAGAVIEVTPGGVEKVLYSFGANGRNDGAHPWGGLIQASDGNFYGMTKFGGVNNNGAVIEVTPSGAEKVLYSVGAFRSGDGAGPSGDLIQASDGNFYGMTLVGGANDTGAVIQVTPEGVEKVLYSFGASGSADGRLPQQNSLIQANDGNFYGMTSGGGAYNYGAVIQITPGGVEKVLHSFGAAGSGDGIYPDGSLIQARDGNFYGMTAYGGANKTGTVIEVMPGGAEKVLYSFGAFGSGDGIIPFGSLVQARDGNFYGMTWQGGAHGTGTVIQVTPGGAEKVRYSFGAKGSGDGGYPKNNSLIQASNDKFYGMTSNGGANNTGMVFKLN